LFVDAQCFTKKAQIKGSLSSVQIRQKKKNQNPRFVKEVSMKYSAWKQLVTNFP